MAIPSGSGSEVLKNSIQSITGASTLACTNDHIFTILNIIIHNNHGGDSLFNIDVSSDGGSNYRFLLHDQPIPNNGTFVFSDKIILNDSNDILKIYPEASRSLYYMINYIDQDWS